MCVYNTINKFGKSNNLVNDKHLGFKHNYSTNNAINKLVSDINWNKKYCAGACLIDMEKAFDTIWLKGLICKLIDYKFPLNLVILLYNMLFGKSFIVNHNNKSSKTFSMMNSFQQSSSIFIHSTL